MGIQSDVPGGELAANFVDKPTPIQQLRTLLYECCTLTPSKKASVQFVRSLVVSVIALIADFGMLVLLKESLGVHYLIAAVLGFCCGILVNYTLSVKWVFAHRKLANRHAEATIFFVICAFGLLFNTLIMAGMVQLASIDYRFAKGVSTVVVFFWNFIARKKILY